MTAFAIIGCSVVGGVVGFLIWLRWVKPLQDQQHARRVSLSDCAPTDPPKGTEPRPVGRWPADHDWPDD